MKHHFDQPLRPQFHFTPASNWLNDPNGMVYYDQDITDAVDATALELDLEPQIAKVQDAQRLIMEKEAPMINIYSGVSFGARWHWYKGLVEGRGSFGLFNGKAWIDSSLRED